MTKTSDLTGGGHLPATGFVRKRLLLEAIPISKSQLHLMINAGKFPPPVSLSKNIRAWSVDVVREFMADPENWEAPNAEG